MLARTADGLYWLARYMERADYVARLLQVAGHMSAARVDGSGYSEWESAIIASGTADEFFEHYDTASPESVVSWLADSKDNPSSIASCIQTARANARAVRTALTTDAWEAVNGSWHELRGFDTSALQGEELGRFLDWVKTRTGLFQGVCASTMLRKDGLHFSRLGQFLERADNTARLLDVKYHVLLPSSDEVGGLLDYYQWLAVLRVVGARRAYRVLFQGRIAAQNVADLLTLRPEFPRSLVFCFGEITRDLDAIQGQDPRRTGEAKRQAHSTYAQLKFGRIEDVMEQGLHEYLTDFIERNDRLAVEIAKGHLF